MVQKMIPRQEDFNDVFRAWVWKRPERVTDLIKILGVSGGTFCSWYTKKIFRGMRLSHLLTLVEVTNDPFLLEWLLQRVTQKSEGKDAIS